MWGQDYGSSQDWLSVVDKHETKTIHSSCRIERKSTEIGKLRRWCLHLITWGRKKCILWHRATKKVFLTDTMRKKKQQFAKKYHDLILQQYKYTFRFAALFFIDIDHHLRLFMKPIKLADVTKIPSWFRAISLVNRLSASSWRMWL